MAFSGGPRLAISGERYVAISGGPEHHKRNLFCLPGQICQVEIYPRGKKAKRKAAAHCIQMGSCSSFHSKDRTCRQS